MKQYKKKVMKLATSLIGLWNLGEQTWVFQLVFAFCLLCVSRIFSSIVPDASFLCALCCRVANERELLFPGNWKSARFGEFLSLSCIFFPGFLGLKCGVVCLISSSCLRFFLLAAAHGVWFRCYLPHMSLVYEIPEDVAVMCKVELSCRCQVSFRGIKAFSFGFLCRVFGWTGLFTFYAEKYCLCWNIVREKHCPGWKKKNRTSQLTSQPNQSYRSGKCCCCY